MAAPRFVQAKKTTLLSGISETETGSIVLRELVDIYGNEIEMSDLGALFYVTVSPGGSDEEIISFADFTRAADGSVALDTSITRGLAAIYPYASGGTARAHAAGTVIVLSDQPQLYKAILDYIDGVAIAGAPNASILAKGLVEMATSAEIDAGTPTGATGAALAVSPDQLLVSLYGTRLPSAAAAAFNTAVTGMVFEYAGTAAPTGFLLCDGTAYDNDTYTALCDIVKGYFGLGTLAAFTAVAATDVITSNSHGLSNGDRVLVESTGTLPAGLAANTVYFVISVTTNTFKVSTSAGGSAVDITDTGSGTHSFSNQFKVPDRRGSTAIGAGARVRTRTFLDANVNTGTDVITVTDNDWLITGQAVVLSNAGGTPPAGLTAGTYYVIRLTSTTIKLASTLALAQAGTAVDITAAAGGGTNTLTQTLTTRVLGKSGGEEAHAMSLTELLAHVHLYYYNTSTGAGGGVPEVSGETNVQAQSGPTSSAGGNAAMNVMAPYTVMNFIVKT